jgi:hypothetical protein
MVADKTRAFVVSTRKVHYLRGAASGDPEADAEGLVSAERFFVLPKAKAQQLHAAGESPPLAQTLVVRLFPMSRRDWTVGLDVEFETEEIEEHEVPWEGEQVLSEGKHADRKFVFVFGPEELPEEVAFEGVHLIDVSEETETGFAPSVEATALRKRPKRLELALLPKPWSVSLACVCACGFEPAGGLSATLVDTVDGEEWALETDEEGLLVHAGISLGHHELRFEGGTVTVPVVHDTRVACRVRLPFHESGAEPELPESWDDDEEDDDELLDAFAHDLAEVEAAEEEEDDEEDDDHDCVALEEADADEFLLSVRFYDRSGRIPYANRTFSVAGEEGETDDSGLALVSELPADFVEVTFAEGSALVPTVWTEAVILESFLPFVTADAGELAARADAEDQAWWESHEGEEPARLLPPEWYPGEEEDPLEPDDEDPYGAPSDDTNSRCSSPHEDDEDPDELDHDLAAAAELLE